MAMVQMQDLHLCTHVQCQFPLVLLYSICSFLLHSICLLQVLNNLRSFKHGHTSIRILHHHASKITHSTNMATLTMRILFMRHA